MLDTLTYIDKQWLLAINGAHSPWADALFWHVSQAVTWLPLYIVLLACLIIKFRHHWKVMLIALVLFAVAVGGADIICAQIIKPLVARPRPTHDAELSALIHVVNGYYGGAYGFCSNHAANVSACAILTIAIFTHNQPKRTHLYVTVPIIIWVLLNCYSRMYLGVHYPTDILVGLMIGCVTALAAWQWGKRYLFPNDAHGHPDVEE